jgi:uncharacterized membrane protein YfcA
MPTRIPCPRPPRPSPEPTIQSLSAIEIAYCCVVIVLFYAARGSTGFGGAAAMPLLGLVIPIKVLVPAWTVIGLAAGVTLLGRDRKHVDWREMARMLPSSVIGILGGLYLFATLDARLLTRGLGLAVLLYGLYALWRTFQPQARPPRASRALAHVAGALSGLIGTTFGAMASVFFAIYFDMIQMPKDAFRATMTAALLVFGATRGLGYVLVGEFGPEVWLIVAIALPMMLLGIFIGDRLHTGLSEITFRRVISAMLLVTGVALLVK